MHSLSVTWILTKFRSVCSLVGALTSLVRAAQHARRFSLFRGWARVLQAASPKGASTLTAPHAHLATAHAHRTTKYHRKSHPCRRAVSKKHAAAAHTDGVLASVLATPNARCASHHAAVHGLHRATAHVSSARRGLHCCDEQVPCAARAVGALRNEPALHAPSLMKCVVES